MIKFKLVQDKIHEHTTACADTLMKSRMLERSSAGRGLGLTPHRSMTKVTPTELLPYNSSLGLPLGLEAPIVTIITITPKV